MLTLINVTAWALLMGLPIFGLRRGSSAVFCVGIYLILFKIIIDTVSSPLAASLPLVVDASQTVNAGWWRVLLFIPLFALAFPLGLYLNRFLGHSFEPFDEIVGLVLGVVVSLFVVRAFLVGVTMCMAGSDLHASLHSLFLVQQFVTLDGYRGFEGWITNLHRATEFSAP